LNINFNSNIEYDLITIDIKDQIPGLEQEMDINYIIGNSLFKEVLKEVKILISRGDKKIGLLYVDSVHTYDHVMDNLKLYGKEFHPKYVILDDIHINPSMELLWSKLSIRYESVDISEMVKRSCGFGVIRCR
jgi:cephalosporin hydroxylase